MKFIKITIQLSIFSLVLFFASHVSAYTEFVSVVDTGGTGDFISLSQWESTIQSDLTATSTLVFSYSSASGTIPNLATVVGEISGAIATSTFVTSTTTSQILLTNVVGVFQAGETVYIEGQASSSNYVIISDSGDQAIPVAKCRSTDGSADTTAVTVDGWTTASTTYIKIWTDPDDVYGRHDGVWDEGKYRLEINGSDYVISIKEKYVKVYGIQLKAIKNNFNPYVVRIESNSENTSIGDNIIKSDFSGTASGAGILTYNDCYIFNNFIYNILNNDNGLGSGIIKENYDTTLYAYNNTFYNVNKAIDNNMGSVLSLNNIAQICNSDCYEGGFMAISSNNVSSDTTAPGANSKASTTVQFLDAANNDFHLAPNDTAARDAGTTSTSSLIPETYYDIDGTSRGAAFDIGADEVPVEFISTICENTSAGGDCANLDYNSLSTWEDKVESNLSTSTTRVFSGSITGTLNENTNVNLCNGATDLGIDAVVVATTSDQILIDGITGTTTPLSVASGTIWSAEACASMANYWTITGTLDQLGASPIAIAKIDGAWTEADTTYVMVDTTNWETDNDNYIKIYTTGNARHLNKWSTDRYRIEDDYTILWLADNYVTVDGLQLRQLATTSDYKHGIRLGGNNHAEYIISNNIIRGNKDTTGQGNWGIYPELGLSSKLTAYNNIIYNFTSIDGIGIQCITNQFSCYLYSNTIYNTNIGIAQGNSTTVFIKNNLVASTTNAFNGTFHASSTNNATDINDTPTGGSNTITNATISFVSTASGTEDFHLDRTKNSQLINAGADLSNDAGLSGVEKVDIDGGMRDPDGLGWDIGADEIPVKIYRSIAPSASAALTTGTANAVTISSTTRLATFNSALSDSIGVGDVIVYNASSTATSTAFISGRNSSTVFALQTASGTAPTAITDDTTWSIYRAYTTLANAETGTENTGIPAAVRNFDAWSGGKNLVSSTSNEQWNIAAYANGTTADTAAVTINGWTTAEQNYIKIYTPTASNEVGATQRHSGKWDDGKYNIEYTATGNYSRAIMVNDLHVRLDGIQVGVNTGSYTQPEGIQINSDVPDIVDYQFSNNIVKRLSGTSTDSMGIAGDSNRTPAGKVYIYNNIVTGFNYGIANYNTGNTYVYNNTVYENTYGIRRINGNVLLKNNITQNCTDGYYGTFDASSDFNISNIDQTDADSVNATFDGYKTVSFIDSANSDFHLSPSDTTAIDAGTTSPLSLIPETSYDIDGHYRRTWDIGADEASVEFVSVITENAPDDGDFNSLNSWESQVNTDLVATTTAVFSASSTNYQGSFQLGATFTGQTSGASGTLVSISTTSNQMLLSSIKGDFQSGETLASGYATTTILDAGNPAIALAKIDGAWSNPDTSAVTINGWTTGPRNYVKIYTTDVARHNGVWDEGRYRLEVVNNRNIHLYENYIWIDGLQMKNTVSLSGVYAGIYTTNINAGGSDIKISNNIIRGNTSGSATYVNGITLNDGDINTAEVWNNIVYDFTGENSSGIYLWSNTARIYAYNNTVFNSLVGVAGVMYVVLKNNIAQDCVNGFYSTFDASSDYNISDVDQTDADSVNATFNGYKTVQFVDSTNDDFHLDPTDTAAKNSGVSYSAGSFTVAQDDISLDIDGQPRYDTGWDIGADEAPTIIYRSVGAHSNDLSLGEKTADITVATNTATAVFSAPIPDNVGVGDAIQYGSPLQIAFITGRTSSTTYSVQSATGSAPVATTSASAAVYRTHLHLDDWEDQIVGDVNPSIDDAIDDFALVNQNLTASNTAMFVPCYASTSADNLATTINGWTTATTSYIKIYTPVSSSEAGESQRHAGVWDDSKFRIIATSTSGSSPNITIQDTFVTIEGVQLHNNSNGYSYNGGIALNFSDTPNLITIKNNLITGAASTSGNPTGISTYHPNCNADIYNNIIYNFYPGDGISVNPGRNINIYNNTITGNDIGIFESSGITVLINNAIFNNADDFSGPINTINNNASDDANGINIINMGSSTAIWKAAFADYENNDFRIRDISSVLYDAGITISIVTDDIIGTARPYYDAYDIGAFEFGERKPEFRTSPGAHLKFKGDFIFR